MSAIDSILGKLADRVILRVNRIHFAARRIIRIRRPDGRWVAVPKAADRLRARLHKSANSN